MDPNDPKLRQVWAQQAIPVVVRAGRVRPLVVRLPYSTGNRSWLQGTSQRVPEWLPAFKAWSIPKSWFERVLRAAIGKYGSVYVVQPYRTSEKCAPACWNAVGADCECSCMGANHGSANPDGRWHVVSETCAVKWG